MPRLFIAIPLPPRVKELIGSFRIPIPGARWVSQEQVHLTLHFLGDRPDTDIPLLVSLLEGVADWGGISLVTTGPGTFGPYPSPRVLWLGIEQSLPLHRLHRTLGERLVSAGFSVDNRSFHPHLTIARLKGVGREALLPLLARPPAHVTFPVERIVLFGSRLSTEGATHWEIASVFSGKGDV
ncbi:MAG: RNA 2',3'-cyclic phosphodiesterase [Desulfuromonadia bacterium]